MVPLPPLDSLRCFTEAARLLNFRAAARVVALTPAAVGQRIRQLEETVGRPLFVRTSRSVALTQAGLAFLPLARETLASAERAVDAARGARSQHSSEIVLGTRYELGLSWILPITPKLRRRHPGTVFHLYFGSGPDLLARVRGLDVHCAIGSMRVSDPLISTLPLHPERYLLAASPRLLRSTPFRVAQDSRQHTLIDIDFSLPLFGYLRDAAGGAEFVFARTLAVGAGAAVAKLVARGEGVAVLPEYLVRNELRAGKIVRLLPRQSIQQDWFRLYFRSDDPRRSFYELLARTLRTQSIR